MRGTLKMGNQKEWGDFTLCVKRNCIQLMKDILKMDCMMDMERFSGKMVIIIEVNF